MCYSCGGSVALTAANTEYTHIVLGHFFRHLQVFAGHFWRFFFHLLLSFKALL